MAYSSNQTMSVPLQITDPRSRALEWATRLGYIQNNPAPVPTPMLTDSPATIQQLTVFESMLTGLTPCRAVYEDEICGAVVDINPQAPLHVVVFPKQKQGMTRLLNCSSANETLIGHLVLIAKQLAQQQGFGESGYRIVINDGPAAGQSVAHLAVHVLAGRPLAWPPG